MSAEAPVFVDTNVLVYAFDRSAGERHDTAARSVESLWLRRLGCISVQVLQELHVTLTRKVARTLAVSESRTIVADLAAWVVHAPTPDDVIAAVDAQSAFQVSFRDAMALTSAARLGCDVLLSEDLQHGRTYGTVTVVNPFLPAPATAS